MNVFEAFALVALGITLDAIHNHIRREAERRAYEKGYKQGRREEYLRFNGMCDAPVPSCTEHEAKHAVQVADEAFMTELKTKGRAAKKIQKTQ